MTEQNLHVHTFTHTYTYHTIKNIKTYLYRKFLYL